MFHARYSPHSSALEDNLPLPLAHRLVAGCSPFRSPFRWQLGVVHFWDEELSVAILTVAILGQVQLARVSLSYFLLILY